MKKLFILFATVLLLSNATTAFAGTDDDITVFPGYLTSDGCSISNAATCFIVVITKGGQLPPDPVGTPARVCGNGGLDADFTTETSVSTDFYKATAKNLPSGTVASEVIGIYYSHTGRNVTTDVHSYFPNYSTGVCN